LLVALCGLIVWRSRATNAPSEELNPLVPTPLGEIISATEDTKPLSFRRRLRWLLLAFVPSSLMLGVTTFISTDIAAVPLMWVIPLSLYLLTFVVAFARRSAIRLSLLVVLLPLATIVIVISNLLQGLNAKLLILLNLFYFFIAAQTCHLQLAQDRPSTSRLTEFYFWLSLGGVLGGVFNALVAPMVFKSVAEYPLVVLVACLLLPSERTQTRRARVLDLIVPAGALLLSISIALICYSFGEAWRALIFLALLTPAVFVMRRRPIRLALSLAAILVAAAVVTTLSDNVLLVERNFFGILRVTNDPQEHIHWLFHGSTNHGRQSTRSERRCEPLSYYHLSGPLGAVFSNFESSAAARKVAIVGLGTGATSIYAQPNEQWTFYEINPAVVDIARNPEYFAYLTQCSSVSINVVLGDARLRIRESPDASYGLIVLDAFSSDAIPLHLITQQAVDSYLSKLGPEGMLVFHISNRHLDLSTVMADLAASRALYCVGLYDPAQYDIQGKDTSVWVVMARQPSDTGTLANSSFARVLTSDGSRKVWTDDFSNILSVLRWR